jgi:hypothetical protein
VPVSPESFGAPSDSISAIPENSRPNQTGYAPASSRKKSDRWFAEYRCTGGHLPIHLGASTLVGSNRTTTYVIEPSILLNQCGTPAGIITTSPAFTC